jgi:pyridoxamine 5'-phosphate oxidase
MVLCKALEVESGNVVFFTNYQSRKGGELEANPRAACVFHFDHWDRQARVEGRVERVSEAESDAYFATRPLLSRLGAWASAQSRPLERRGDLLKQFEAVMERFGVGWLGVAAGKTDKVIPRPPHWGGFRLRAERVELWQGVAGRLHDRGVWERGVGEAEWRRGRLQP